MFSVAEVPITSLLRERAADLPDRVLAKIDGVSVTYGEANHRANLLANGLAAIGLKRGETVAYMLDNSAEALDCWFGLAKAGLVQVPVNTAQRGSLLAHILRVARCRAVIVDPFHALEVMSVARECPDLGPIIVTGDSWMDSADSARSMPVLGYGELLAGSRSAEPSTRVDLSDIECVLFTSGTTGPSKGVARSFRANYCYAHDIISPMRFSASEHLYCAFPLFHVFARYGGVYPMMMTGGRILMPSHFSVSRFWDICRAEGITAFNFLGAVLLMLHNQPPRDDDADNPVTKGTGSPVPVSIHRDFERRFGVRLLQGYGLTEVGLVVQTSMTESKVGSCGRGLPRFQVEIHDPEGSAVADGETGEIVVRPDDPRSIFSGYVGDEAEPGDTDKDRWFATGDLGYRDADGWLFYVDRYKDCIRRRGENISSWEVEQVLNSHEAVAESAVVGVVAPPWDEEVLAVVVLKDGCHLEPRELRDFCKRNLPDFALPRFVRYVDSLPKTPTERTEKYLLRRQGVTDDTWQRDDSPAWLGR